MAYAKNRNKHPDPYDNHNSECGEDSEKGVNVDNNFWEKFLGVKHICEQFYGGYDLFS